MGKKRKVTDIKVKKNKFTLYITKHGKEQVKRRQINAKDVAETFNRITQEQWLQLQARHEPEIMLVNPQKEITVIIGFHENEFMEKNRVHIVTVIDRGEDVKIPPHKKADTFKKVV